MICPLCGHKGNLPGADWCVWCQFDLAAVDRPTPSDRVEASLMTEPVAALGLKDPVTVSDDADLGRAVREMIGRKVGAVLVTDRGGRLVGILTERDFLTKIAGSDGFERLPVAAFMTRHPETVGPGDILALALGKMAGGGYRHLPVVDAGRPVGVVSVRDVLAHIVHVCRDA
jgi:CBS domain-containing protein